MKKSTILLTALALLIGHMGFTQQLTDSLLLYFPFDGNALDASGNGYNGTVSGATLVNDRFGNPNGAYFFDGIDDFIDLLNTPKLKPSLPVTFAFWVKLESLVSTDNNFFATDFKEDIYYGCWMNADNTGKPGVGYGGGVGNTGPNNRRSKISTSILTTGTWTHIVGIIRGATDMDIYVDCVNTGGTYSGSGPALAYSNVPGTIGRDDQAAIPPFYFWGTMDEFAYWNRALSPQEVDSLCLGAIGINDISSTKERINIYPNPSEGKFTISIPITIGRQGAIKKVEVYDLFGRKVLESKEPEIDMSNYPAGLYIWRVGEARGKLIIE